MKSLAGANVDPEQFALARQARMMEVQARNAERLVTKSRNESRSTTEGTLLLRESFLATMAQQYVGARGRLDDATTYVVDSVRVSVLDGSSLATLILTAVNTRYDVTVRLAMDCILSFDIARDTLSLSIEPFNITPIVEAGGVLSVADELIRDILKVKLARMSEEYPPLMMPVRFSNSMVVPASSVPVRQKINLEVDSSERRLSWDLRITDITFYRGIAVITFSFDSLEVK